jgi:hypothetical protein
LRRDGLAIPHLIGLYKGAPSFTLYILQSRALRFTDPIVGSKGMLKHGLNFKEVFNFIVISLNGAAALYSESRDPKIWKFTIAQLRFYINQLKK